MMHIARRSFFFTALQFVVITNYYVSLRLAKKTAMHSKHLPAEDLRLNQTRQLILHGFYQNHGTAGYFPIILCLSGFSSYFSITTPTLGRISVCCVF